MFDPLFDQAAGLRGVGLPSGVRLVPVSLTRDAAVAYEACWVLANALSAHGYAVVVLDATARERAHAPGLSQWLQTGDRVAIPQTRQGGQSLAATAQAPVSWPTVPSQSGLNSLLHQAAERGVGAALTRLAGVFALGTVVLVMAPKEWLSVLFEETGAQPLVPLVLNPAGVVDAYSAAKVLSQAAALSPVLVPVAHTPFGEVEQRSLSALLETCRKHLGGVPECWPLDDTVDAASTDSAGAWVLRIIGSALVVADDAAPASGWSISTPHEALVPQLWSC